MTITFHPRMPRVPLLLAAVLAVSVVALAAASGAQAAKPKPPKTATFKATLSGSQVTTWEYHDPKNPDDACDNGSTDAYGDQTIKFDRKGTFKITFTKPPKGNPNVFLTEGRPAVITNPPQLKVSAEAERNADVKFTEYPIGSDCPVVSDGGAIPSSERAKDCGVRTGYFSTRLYYYPLISSRNDDDDLFVPIGPGDGYPLKDFLKLETANDQLFIDPRDGSGVTDLEEAYANCPFLLEDAYTPKTGNMYTSANKFSEKRLFDKSRKKLVVSGSKIRKHKGEKTTGQTILAWNLRLTRVK